MLELDAGTSSAGVSDDLDGFLVGDAFGFAFGDSPVSAAAADDDEAVDSNLRFSVSTSFANLSLIHI